MMIIGMIMAMLMLMCLLSWPLLQNTGWWIWAACDCRWWLSSRWRLWPRSGPATLNSWWLGCKASRVKLVGAWFVENAETMVCLHAWIKQSPSNTQCRTKRFGLPLAPAQRSTVQRRAERCYLPLVIPVRRAADLMKRFLPLSEMKRFLPLRAELQISYLKINFHTNKSYRCVQSYKFLILK